MHHACVSFVCVIYIGTFVFDNTGNDRSSAGVQAKMNWEGSDVRLKLIDYRSVTMEIFIISL